jgi:hypothetical protein
MWTNNLQSIYDNFEEFESYDSVYNLAARLGFKSARTAWKANPKVQGSTNPADLKVVKQEKKR